MSEQPFGKSSEGTEETLFTLTNRQGSSLELTSYGARIVSLSVPDRHGKLADVVLGFSDLAPYLVHKAYFGCTTGRYANRIAAGKFDLDGHSYKLAVNNGPNSLHGGLKGFDRRHWQAKRPATEPLTDQKGPGLEFTYESPDGEEGFPGRLSVRVSYVWRDDNVLEIGYSATTDKTTVLNLTNHAYWNLGGVADGKPLNGNVLDEELTIFADRYLPADPNNIPLGEFRPVAGTPLDFRTPHRIGERIEELRRPPSTTKGYDHCYVLDDGKHTADKGGRLEPKLAARVVDSKTGRIMEVLTTEPALQLYTGSFLEGDAASGGFNQYDALCLEAQHYPDAPNRPDFPSTVLKPGETYRQLTVYRFTAK